MPAGPVGFADSVVANNVLVAATEKFLMSVQARGVKAGAKVLILGLAGVQNEATVATHRNTLRVRQGLLITSTQVGEDAIMDSITGATLLITNEIAIFDNAPNDDPTYGLFALDTHADTILNSTLAVIPIG